MSEQQSDALLAAHDLLAPAVEQEVQDRLYSFLRADQQPIKQKQEEKIKSVLDTCLEDSHFSPGERHYHTWVQETQQALRIAKVKVIITG